MISNELKLLPERRTTIWSKVTYVNRSPNFRSFFYLPLKYINKLIYNIFIPISHNPLQLISKSKIKLTTSKLRGIYVHRLKLLSPANLPCFIT